LKQHDKLLLPCPRRRRYRALQKRRHSAQPNHRHATLLQKIPPRKFQPANAFATFVTHVSLALLTALLFRKFDGAFNAALLKTICFFSSANPEAGSLLLFLSL
jgi:hypothetical protein